MINYADLSEATKMPQGYIAGHQKNIILQIVQNIS